MWHGDPNATIWNGGPVMRESCWVLHQPILTHSFQGVLKLSGGLMLSSSGESLKHLSAHPPKYLRFIRGISGWGPSQLDDEIAGGFWLTADLDTRLVFSEPEKMWETGYRQIGVDPGFLAFNRGVN
jgi:putative transcriptional regulator